MKSPIELKQVYLQLGIVVEKRKSNSRWQDWNWVPVGVIPNADIAVEWRVLLQEENSVRYHASTLPLTLHRKDTEALCANLMLAEPVLYIVLQTNDDPASEFPYQPHVVTASEYEMLDWLDAGEVIVEKVAMPDPVASFIQAFVDQHHVEEKFVKRKRDKVHIEEHKFGKFPIFEDITKH